MVVERVDVSLDAGQGETVKKGKTFTKCKLYQPENRARVWILNPHHSCSWWSVSLGNPGHVSASTVMHVLI